jgi:CRISPR-associated protein Cmr2
MIFELSIGPVQSFVAQARRTRDFWAGSFLLAWLSGVARQSVLRHCPAARIEFPHVDDADIAWISSDVAPAGDARLARLSNHLCADVDDTLNPENVVADVRAAWRFLADDVWQADLAPLWPCTDELFPQKSDVLTIFNRQIDHAFELTWAFAGTQQLHLRKLWRSHARPPEPGVKCSLHAGLQELSGYVNEASSKAFWAALQARTGERLRDNERLSAVAYVKRRFAHHFRKVDQTLPSGLRVKGIALPNAVPSTADIAAGPWLARMLTEAPVKELTAFVNAVPAHARTGSANHLAAAVAAVCEQRNEPVVNDAACADADVYYDSRLDDRKRFTKAQADEILNKINKLPIDDKPSPFYVVLRMDVDSLGAHDNKSPIAEALSKFATRAAVQIRAADGFTVFAGGDDLLALLPKENALRCAAQLRQTFVDAVAETAGVGEPPVTISAAVVFAHIMSPLTRVLAAAQKILDEHAKKRAGRDAIAVRVIKRSGIAADWWMPWEKALAPAAATTAGTPAPARRLQVEMLAEQLSANPVLGKMSSKFLYKIRTRLEHAPLPENAATLLPELALNLMTSEYLASFAGAAVKPSLQEAREFVQPVLAQCRLWRRLAPRYKYDEATYQPVGDAYRADAALIARFIAARGKDDA